MSANGETPAMESSGTSKPNADLKAKERMKILRQEMPSRDADERSASFNEVNLGLDERLAILEARRCLGCKDAKCMRGCPVQIDIPGFVTQVADGNFEEAAKILYSSNALPGICGRVCPQESQCEAECVRSKGNGCSVAIGHLERFVADWARERRLLTEGPQAPTGYKVAVIGGGPAGLTCAGELNRKGHFVTLFEALHEAGGVLVYGIPQFRLPKEIVRDEVEQLRESGVEIVTNVVIGQTYTIEDLLGDMGYHAVFIANGAGLPIFLGIAGENLKGVYSANEYLTRVNLMKAYQSEAMTPVLKADNVVVIGGGNTAMDAVRTARRLGAKNAYLVYRRSRDEMPARIEEVHHAEEEGIQFQMLTNPLEILGDDTGWVRGIRAQRMELGEPDASGRRRPIAIPGSEFEIECSVVVEAIGTRANPLLTATTPDLKVNEKGYIITNDEGLTSKPGVFAGGDIVRGAATVILAMGDGKNAAGHIDKWLRSQTAQAVS